MTQRTQALVLLVLLVVLMCVPVVSAHHAWPVNQERLVTVKGTVTSIIWANPHPMIAIDVRNDAGEVEKWSIGGPAINRMVANGWSESTVKPGDEITGIGYQFRDGTKVIRLERVMLPDGREMRVYARR